MSEPVTTTEDVGAAAWCRDCDWSFVRAESYDDLADVVDEHVRESGHTVRGKVNQRFTTILTPEDSE